MIPVRLSVKGFLSYLEAINLDFTSFELACITGANGAGKSSLLDAITWALFGQARRRDDALINRYATAAEVTFDFEYENGMYRVQRSKQKEKTTILDFFVAAQDTGWKVLTEPTLRETEARIQQTLRLDYETFINASFFLQGKADLFAQQRPGDRKRILSSILGLEVWEEYRERAAERRKKLEGEISGIEGMLAEIHNELNEETQRRSRKAKLEDELETMSSLRLAREQSLENLRRLAASLAEQRRMVEILSGQWNATNLRLQQRMEQLTTRQTDREVHHRFVNLADEIQRNYQDWLTAREELEKLDLLSSSYREQEKMRTGPLLAIQAAYSALQQERSSLIDKQRQMAKLDSENTGLEQANMDVHLKLTEYEKTLEQRPHHDQRLLDLQLTGVELKAENETLKQEMNQIKERVDRLKITEGAVCPICGQALTPDDRERLVINLLEEGKQKGDRFRTNLESMQKKEVEKKSIETIIDNLRRVENDQRVLQRQFDQQTNQLGQNRKILDEWTITGQQRLGELENIITEEDFAKEDKARLAEIDAGLKKLGYDPSVHDTTRKREQTGRESEQQMRQLDTARSALIPLNREIKELEIQINADQLEAEGQESTCRQAEAQYQNSSAQLPDLRLEEGELYRVQEQENRLRMQVGAASQAVEVLKTLRSRSEEMKTRNQALTHQVMQLKMLEKSFSKDGVPALLIEQALPEIEQHANEVLDLLSNSGMSVRFITQKEFKDKNRDDKKETLDIVISDAAGPREYELFSGGEAFRVNFAIRLALSQVLAQRSGARLQMLVIDEGFGSQDEDGRQKLIEAINQVQRYFAKILVITHLEDLKEAFPVRIEVEKQGKGSQVKISA